MRTGTAGRADPCPGKRMDHGWSETPAKTWQRPAKNQPSPGLRRRRSLFGGKSRSVREWTTFLFGNGPILEQSFPFVLCGIHARQCSMLILCGPPAKQRGSVIVHRQDLVVEWFNRGYPKTKTRVR